MPLLSAGNDGLYELEKFWNHATSKFMHVLFYEYLLMHKAGITIGSVHKEKGMVLLSPFV